MPFPESLVRRPPTAGLLGVRWPFRFMVNGFHLPRLLGRRWVPGWYMPAIMLLVVPWLVAAAIEWRVVVPWEQYYGVYPGDIFLSLAFGISIYNMSRSLPLRTNDIRWFQRGLWHVWCVVFGLGMAGFFAYGEITNTTNQYVPDAAYTWPQIYSPSHLLHWVLLVIGGYTGMATVAPFVLGMPGLVVKRFVVLLLVLAWAYCAFYLDNTLPRPDLADVHPLNGGWFGPHGLNWWRSHFG